MVKVLNEPISGCLLVSLIIFEFKCTEFSVHPASSSSEHHSLDRLFDSFLPWLQANVCEVLEDMLHSSFHFWVFNLRASFLDVTEGVKQGLNSGLTAFVAFQVVTDRDHVVIEMHGHSFLLPRALDQGAKPLDELGKLSLNVKFIMEVNLESHELNFVLLENHLVLFGCHDERKRYTEQQLVNMGLDSKPGLLCVEILGQELD